MSFLVEINYSGEVSCCDFDGNKLSGQLLLDMEDCYAGGDCENACQYILDNYSPEFWIVKSFESENNNHYLNSPATSEDKQKVCEVIYSESDTDFSDENNANLYLIWEAAHSIIRESEYEY